VIGAETLSTHHRLERSRATASVGMAQVPWCWAHPANPALLPTHIHADGRHKELLRTTTGTSTGSHEPALMRMEGNAVFKMAVNTLDRIVDENARCQWFAKIRYRLAGAAPGEYPHHFRHRKEARHEHDHVVTPWRPW